MIRSWATRTARAIRATRTTHRVRGPLPAAAALLLAATGLVGLLGSGVATAAGPSPTVLPGPTLPGQVPLPQGVGQLWARSLSAHDQVLVVSGPDLHSITVTATAWERTGTGWQSVGTWAGNSAKGGWGKTRRNDHRSPVGMYGLTAAGGYFPDPGTRLPYQHDTRLYALRSHGVRTFSYVVAIDYKRIPGTPPMSPIFPLGWNKGGHVWVHEVHNGTPTDGCVVLPRPALLTLLHWLDPTRHPVILMGPQAVLARMR